MIEPAPGRERMPFLQTVDEGRVSVIPFDAQQLVVNGVLDAKLFDVSKPATKALIHYTVDRFTSMNITEDLWHQINPKAPAQTDTQDHPDLKGRIKVTKNFTGDDNDVTDEHGHGTHVAGIIAGMQWAAEQGAKVVNLSLGGDATDGTDELSQVLNTLSAKYNALFVVAAGNVGRAESVGSPAAADAALAVASVTKQNRLSYFSSRGPRLDGAVKPEISAPGYAIAAARARNTSMGYPLDDRYTLASGTSMASPHVTGAAAILAGEHPDWSAARLKAALTGTADPAGAQVFEEGTGVVNLDRATKTQLTAEPATLKLGTGTITYRNDSAQKIKLTITKPADVEADRTTVEVPARGTATATFKAVKPGAGDVIIAKDDNTVLRTAVSTRTKNEPTGRLKVGSIARDGAPNGTGGYGFLVAMANHTDKKLYAGGIGNGRGLQGDVPQGRYTVFAWVPSPIDGRPPWEPSQTLVAQDVTVGPNGAEATLDARTGQRLEATVNGVTGTGHLGTSLGTPNGSAFASQGDDVYVVPGSANGMIYTAVQFVRNVPTSTSCGSTTSTCAIAVSKENALAATFPDVKDAGLAKATAKIGKPEATGEWITFAEHPLSTPPPGDAAENVTFPGTHTTYYHSTGDVEWWSAQTRDQLVVQAQTWRSYTNGKTYEEKWSHGAYGPSTTMRRNGDIITANTALLSDSTPGHYGFAGDQEIEGRVELKRDGKLVDGINQPGGGTFQVPPGKARYRLEAVTKTVQAAWAFCSK